MAPMGLDLRLCASKSIVGFIEGQKFDELEESVRRLEEERTKIEAFKRELPLCVELVSDVIVELKKELERRQGQGQRFPRVSEELTLGNCKGEEDFEKDCMEKKNWMSSVQLWNDSSSSSINLNNKIENKVGEERNERTFDRRLESPTLFSNLPFKGLPVLSSAINDNKKLAVALPQISLASLETKGKEQTEDNRSGGLDFKYTSRMPVCAPVQIALQNQQQNQRKNRRCWSQELHRRFLFALEELGGFEVATPKQIREVMKIDGLTNDEVKSHLQKYRLHTRKMPNSSAFVKMPNSSAFVNHPDVVMKGLWASSEKRTAVTPPQNVSQFGSPESPLQLTLSDRTISTTAGDSCEDEGGKSEVYSWK